VKLATRRADGRIFGLPASRSGLAGVGLALGLGLLWSGDLSCVAAGTTAGAASREQGGAGSSGPRPGVGHPAPEIVVERLNGQELALSSLRGKVVLLDVWASWCVPCQKELPMLDAIARRLRSKGVEVVAVSIDQERGNVVKFLDTQPRWVLTVAHDPRGAIAETYQPEKMPTSYVIDRAGIIRHVNDGFEPADAAVIERRLTELAAAAGGDAHSRP
jgi:thiol-disulfide isomerase/thioredoxin